MDGHMVRLEATHIYMYYGENKWFRILWFSGGRVIIVERKK